MDGLRAIRKQRGLTLKQIEDLTGIDLNTISRYERGLVTPSGNTLLKISDSLGVSVDELLHGPKDNKIKITLTWDKAAWEDEISMNGNAFQLLLSTDGTVGIRGAAMFTNKETLKDTVKAIAEELEAGYDFQIQRGRIQEDNATKNKKH